MVKVTLEQAMKAYVGLKVYLYSCFNLGGCSMPRPGRCISPCARDWVGPQTVWMGAENSPPPLPTVFDPRTDQPVARRYTEWAIPALTMPFPASKYRYASLNDGDGFREMRR